MNTEPKWEAFIPPNLGAACQTCYDYGGLLALNTTDDEGLPWMRVCHACKGLQSDG